jgi:hypothetical protein
VLYVYDTQYPMSKLPELGDLVSRISGFVTAVNNPILGERKRTRVSRSGFGYPGGVQRDR